jgi:assimilatory nitrate reductase electron transfer subunit
VDLASMGEIPGSGDADGQTEVVSVSDPGRGCYGALALRSERVTGAILLGLPAATGAVTQLYDSGDPAPLDRFGLLLGRAAGAPAVSPGEMSEHAMVCRCNGVTKSGIVEAWHGGARVPAALGAATRAGTGCGSCAGMVADICAWLAGPDERLSSVA